MEHLKSIAARIKHARESNKGKEIKIGAQVIDIYCRKGTVIKAVKPKKLTVESHGAINVKDIDGDIEHYTYWNWNEMLKITN